jgi:hypothetical protein
MTNRMVFKPALTDRIPHQGRVLICAIEPGGPFDRALARILLALYKRRLHETAGTAFFRGHKGTE